MNTNTDNIDRIHSSLDELATISQKEEFDKSVVIQRIKTINNDLEEINSVREEILQEHTRRETELYAKFDLQKQTMKDFEKDVKKYMADVKADMKAIKKSKYSGDKKRATDFLTDERRQEIKQAITIPKNEISTVLSNYNYRRLATKRKRWIWWTNLLFQSDYWSHQIGKLLLGTAIAYGLAKLAALLFNTPDYLVAAIVALLLFATGNRIIEKKYNRIFWSRIRMHTLKLYHHFDLYLTHMTAMMEDKKL